MSENIENLDLEKISASRKESENTSLSHTLDDPVYALGFSNSKDKPVKVAIGSYLENDNNKLRVLEVNDSRTCITEKHAIEQKYPATAIMWSNYTNSMDYDLIATTSDCLRLYKETDTGINLQCELMNSQQKELASPMTSFDWNPKQQEIICCASIDTTCSIWDIEEEKLSKLVIAHDKEVFDVSFSPEGYSFATVGADNTARLFDIRDLTQSNIIYDHREPLVRIAWNNSSKSNILALVSLFQEEVILLDIRQPFFPMTTLKYHKAPVNNVVWSPYSPYLLCSISTDKHAYLWNVEKMEEAITSPVLEYSSDQPLNNVTWCSFTDWIGITKHNSFIMLRII